MTWKTEAPGSFEFSVSFYKTTWHYMQEDRLIIVTGMGISNLTFHKLFSMYMKHSLKVYHIDFINFLEDRNLVCTVMLIFLVSMWSINETKCWYIWCFCTCMVLIHGYHYKIVSHFRCYTFLTRLCGTNSLLQLFSSQRVSGR